ncbi:MAG TPA: hypothetical protein VFH68_23410 [Polyangia bacterium]|nr:hypothetical protein [Polyangia bacterium]
MTPTPTPTVGSGRVCPVGVGVGVGVIDLRHATRAATVISPIREIRPRDRSFFLKSRKLAWEKFSQQETPLTDRDPVTKKSVNVAEKVAVPEEKRRNFKALRGRN